MGTGLVKIIDGHPAEIGTMWQQLVQAVLPGLQAGGSEACRDGDSGGGWMDMSMGEGMEIRCRPVREGEIFFTAWSEGELVLPRPWRGEDAMMEEPWYEMRFFSPGWEIRRLRRGKRESLLFLGEDEAVLDELLLPLGAGEKTSCIPYPVCEPHLHFLWGKERQHGQGQKLRVEVRFPRPLDYGLTGDQCQYRLALRCMHYLDREFCLREMRYRDMVYVQARGER